MSFRVDAVEIMNRFTEYSPSRGETPLPLPIPGFWFKRICALADRVAKAENQNDDLQAEVARLTAELAAANEDAERLAGSWCYWDEREEKRCVYCGAAVDLTGHAADCPITPHRARVGGGNK